MKVLDAFGVPDPASLVRDVNALGADGIGGYAYDDDVLSANPWTGAHVDAVRAAGKAFLPIITLRTSSPASWGTLVAALRALNCHGGPVGWDVENTATPPYDMLSRQVAGVRALGYGPMTGYFWPPLTWRPVYGDLFDFHWWGSGGAAPQIPAGWDAIQYGQEVANGTAYDVNVFDPVIFGGDMTPEQDAMLRELRDKVNQMWTEGHGPAYVQAHGANVSDLVAKLATATGVDPTALAAAVVAAEKAQWAK